MKILKDRWKYKGKISKMDRQRDRRKDKGKDRQMNRQNRKLFNSIGIWGQCYKVTL